MTPELCTVHDEAAAFTNVDIRYGFSANALDVFLLYRRGLIAVAEIRCVSRGETRLIRPSIKQHREKGAIPGCNIFNMNKQEWFLSNRGILQQRGRPYQ